MHNTKSAPPKIVLKFFRWFCHPKLLRHIEGDLMELYSEILEQAGKGKADIKFAIYVYCYSGRALSDLQKDLTS